MPESGKGLLPVVQAALRDERDHHRSRRGVEEVRVQRKSRRLPPGDWLVCGEF